MIIPLDVYKIPEAQLPSIAGIINSYLCKSNTFVMLTTKPYAGANSMFKRTAYVNDFLSARAQGAHRPSIAIMAKPVMMLYQGGQGRRFRRALGEEMIMERKKSKDSAIYNLDRVVYRAMEQVNVIQEDDVPQYQRASL
jgi:hypothetical protein